MKRLAVLAALVGCQGNSLESQTYRLSLPAGGRVVTPPGPAQVGPRVETAACYAGRSAEALAREVAGGLSDSWSDVRVVPRPGRWVILGEGEGFGLAGVVAPGAPCADGEVWVSIGAHAVGAPGGTAAGPVGPRRHLQGRLPVVPRPE